MKLTLQLQLSITRTQGESLWATLTAFNLAANFAARTGFDANTFTQAAIHKLCYKELRSRFSLSAQMAVRAIAKAVEVFRRDKTICPEFQPDGAMTYDERILSWKGTDKVSILTLEGRILVPFQCGAYQRDRLDWLQGQVDLIARDGRFFLYTTIDVPEPSPRAVTDVVGVDLGIVSLATTDDGTTFCGQHVDGARRRSARARQTYQRRNTRSARRRLRKMSRRQSRFQKDVNHVVSKSLVAKALREGKGLAVEELAGIRTRCEATVRKTQRSRLSNWSFSQLRLFLTYKARLVGVPVVAVDPRNTSRMCSACGHCAKGNRKSQGHFECLDCGYTVNADQNGACNIRLRALAVSVKNRDSVATSGQQPDSATSRPLEQAVLDTCNRSPP